VRGFTAPIRSTWIWFAGFGLQTLEYDGRHSRITGHQAFTGRVVRGPRASRSSSVTARVGNHEGCHEQRIGR
jgi:hypothetical protein